MEHDDRPALADVESYCTVAGPDGRFYIGVPASQGRIPRVAGRPTPAVRPDDADAEGDTYHLWSVSLSDAQDVRDEGLTFGSLAFTPSSMVWTDSTNGAAGRVHVRDLSSGEEHSFDPHAGDRCNLLSFGATDDRIVMGEYCGTYDHGVRDDRVQVPTTDGEQVTTIQDSGLDGAIAGTGASTDFRGDHRLPRPTPRGTYLYDLGTDRLIRVSDAIARFAMGGPVPAGQFV